MFTIVTKLKLAKPLDAETFFETQEALDDVSSKIAGPWFAENVRPYLGGPVERSVGEVVARFGT